MAQPLPPSRSATFLGLYLGIVNDTFILKGAVVNTITATMGYIETQETPALASFRSLLFDHRPTSAILFIDDASVTDKDILTTIESEFYDLQCTVQTIQMDDNIDEVKTAYIKAVTTHLIQPPSEEATTTTTGTKSKTGRDSHSIFSNQQIAQSAHLFKSLIAGEVAEYTTSANTAVYMLAEIFSRFIDNNQQQQQDINITDEYPLEYIFNILELKQFLRIDSQAMVALGVIKSPTDTVQSMYLSGLLDKCQTAFGSRLLQSWVATPLIDIYQINQRQLTVSAFTNASAAQTLDNTRQVLRGIADIEKVLAKLNKFYAQTTRLQQNTQQNRPDISADIIKELLHLYRFADKVSSITQALSGLVGEPLPNRNPQISDDVLCEEDLYVTQLIDGEDDDDESQQQTEDATTTMDDVPSVDGNGDADQANASSGAVPRGKREIQVLSHDNLLKNSHRLTPEQFVTLRFTRELSTYYSGFQRFHQLVRYAVDLKAVDNHEYFINPSLTEELQNISLRKEQVSKAVKRLHTEIGRSLGVDAGKIKLGYTAVNNIGFFFRVTRKDESLIRDTNIYQTLETRKDGVRFTTTNLSKLSKEYILQVKAYKALQYELAVSLLQTSSTYFQDFSVAASVIAELDVLTSFAYIATTAPIPYVRPTLISPVTGICTGNRDENINRYRRKDSDTQNLASRIILKQARHPCLEVQPNTTYIPNDFELIHGLNSAQIVTGPNMGGKSCYLRTLALVVLMAQIGCFVPCREAKIYLVDCILARVGAGDAQRMGISTFMKEMIETSQIFQHATQNSLILIDELGRGTSTYDGFGLAWGITEYLATQTQGYVLFPTHFHELTAMESLVPTVTNKHVTASTATADEIAMLYKVQDGFCDRSFGIHVAQIANFPEQVLAVARAKSKELESSLGTTPQYVAQSIDTDDNNAVVATSTLATLPHQRQQQLIDQIFAVLDKNPQQDLTRLFSSVDSKVKSWIRQ